MQRVKIKILQMNKVYGLFVLVYSNHYDNAKYLKLKDITEKSMNYNIINGESSVTNQLILI